MLEAARPSRPFLSRSPLASSAEDFEALPELVTFTVDVEDLAGDAPSATSPRYADATARILDFLAERDAVGTFFVVGEVAERTPRLVREIAARGHEVASHSYRHRPLTAESAASFRRSIADHRRRVEDLAGSPVQGFRAPVLSLTPATAWAAEALADAGFAYSSSVVPARGFAFGWPGAPTGPFRWPCGLLELPCPLGRVGPFRLPFLGGTYLRHLPPWRLRRAVRTCSTEIVWTYCHPYDVDVGEPFRRLPGLSFASSFFLWWNRASTLRRLDLILRGRRTATFAARLGPLAASASTFAPAATGTAAGPRARAPRAA